MIREPPDHTGSEPTLDIPIGGSGQDRKTKWQIHAMCENMLIMKYVPHLSTDKEGKKPKICLNACWVLKEISTDKKTAVAKNAAMQYGWIEKEEMEFPVLCHLVAREFYIRW